MVTPKKAPAYVVTFNHIGCKGRRLFGRKFDHGAEESIGTGKNKAARGPHAYGLLLAAIKATRTSGRSLPEEYPTFPRQCEKHRAVGRKEDT